MGYLIFFSFFVVSYMIAFAVCFKFPKFGIFGWALYGFSASIFFVYVFFGTMKYALLNNLSMFFDRALLIGGLFLLIRLIVKIVLKRKIVKIVPGLKNDDGDIEDI